MRLTLSQSFFLLISIVVSFLAGSSAPTPLYAEYQSLWGFSPITVTIVFGAYAVAVLASLLVFGSLSDSIGRRPVLFVSALAQIVAMFLFATAHGVSSLIVARVVQGLATGAAASTVGAGLLDIDRTRGALANSVSPMLGTATGVVLSGIFVAFVPYRTISVFLFLAIVFAIQSVSIVAMPETATRRAFAWSSLRPRFEVPDVARAPLVTAIPALVSAWALVGFYGSLGPAVLRRFLTSSSSATGGLALFVLAASGAITVYLARSSAPRAVLAFGCLALAGGVAVTLVGITVSSLAWFALGTVVAGAGFGASFQGAIRSVVTLAGPNERAGVLSLLYVVSYLAMGLPAVAAGVRVVHGGNLSVAAREYGIALIALSLVAFLGVVVRRRSASRVDGRTAVGA